jgi:hypothetical protein
MFGATLLIDQIRYREMSIEEFRRSYHSAARVIGAS